MADPRFFDRQGPFTIDELAKVSQSEIRRGDPGAVIDDEASLDNAQGGHLSFFDNLKYKASLKTTKAAVVILNEKAVEFAPAGCALLVSKNPYKGYALISQKYYPVIVTSDSFISDRADVSSSASIGKGCRIESGVVIGENVVIGDNTVIEANTVIYRGVTIGQGCHIGSNVSITHALIGDYVRLYSGVRVGQDGFGFAIDPAGHVKVPQLGRVIIEDHVEIGANTTIDRGAGPDTVIGAGTWIDNLVQIGHNVKIGRGCVLVSQVGIAGSTVVDDFVVLAGQVGVAGHLHIGAGAQIAAKSGVMKNVPAGAKLMGYPAIDMKEHLKQIAFLKRMRQNK